MDGLWGKSPADAGCSKGEMWRTDGEPSTGDERDGLVVFTLFFSTDMMYPQVSTTVYHVHLGFL